MTQFVGSFLTGGSGGGTTEIHRHRGSGLSNADVLRVDRALRAARVRRAARFSTPPVLVTPLEPSGGLKAGTSFPTNVPSPHAANTPAELMTARN